MSKLLISIIDNQHSTDILMLIFFLLLSTTAVLLRNNNNKHLQFIGGSIGTLLLAPISTQIVYGFIANPEYINSAAYTKPFTILMIAFYALLLVFISTKMLSKVEISGIYNRIIKKKRSLYAFLIFTAICFIVFIWLKFEMLFFVYGVLIFPVIEEICFRLILPIAINKEVIDFKSSILFSVIFALLHHSFIYPFIISMILYAIYRKTKNLFLAITLHSMHNFLLFMLFYFADRQISFYKIL